MIGGGLMMDDANVLHAEEKEIKMANVSKKACSNSPKTEVGEVDTRAPFQSVKAAVSLFGEVAVSRGKQSSSPATAIKKRQSETNALDQETQLLLTQRELDQIKQQLLSSQITKARALSELDKAKRTLEDLYSNLKSVSYSKQSAMKDAEEIKVRAKNLEEMKTKESIEGAVWKQELDHARNEYTSTVTQLDATKQELTKIRQDFDAALEAKLVAFQQAAEAQRLANVNSDRVTDLQKEVATMQASIEQLKLASLRAQQEQGNVVAQREVRLQTYKIAKQQVEDKLLSLKEEADPELISNLEDKLEQTTVEIEVLQEEMRKAHACEMDSVRVVTMELNEATKGLQQVAEEESHLRSMVSSLRLELEDVKRESCQLKDKEMELEALATSLSAELEKTKKEADRATIQQLSSKTENARIEAEEMKKNADQQKRDAEDNRNTAKVAEKKLKIALEEVEDAKEAEKRALHELNSLSGRHDDLDSESTSTPGKLKLSLEDYECLSRKVKECERLVEIKEAECIVQVEAINVRKNEVDKKLEANLKAIEEIKTATDLALRNAESAESIKLMVEGELLKWHQEEQTMVVGEVSGSLPLHF